MTEIGQIWKPTICIYHGGCIDGFTAAWAVWRRWGDDVRYVPMGYGDAPPEVGPDDHVLMVDFSLKRDALMALTATAASVVVLDHHKTAADDLAGPYVCAAHQMHPESVETMRMRAQPDCALYVFFDMERSGARLAWEFCHGAGDVPNLVMAVEDRDLWRFAWGDQTRKLHAFLAAVPQTFETWEAAAQPEAWTANLIVGAAILGAHQKNVEAMLINAHERIIGGHRVPCVNVPYFMASDTGHALLQKFPDAPFAATFYIRGDGQRQYSLRSADDRVDVSEVARKFGGGGHRNAAGFTVPE